MTSKNNKWILVRGDKIIGTFDSRQKGVKHLQDMINQTLNDLKGQEESSKFDYNIEIPKIQLYGVEIRPSYLGL